jgi:hypothetical protein
LRKITTADGFFTDFLWPFTHLAARNITTSLDLRTTNPNNPKSAVRGLPEADPPAEHEAHTRADL